MITEKVSEPVDTRHLTDEDLPAERTTENNNCPWCGKQMDYSDGYEGEQDCEHCGRPIQVEIVCTYKVSALKPSTLFDRGEIWDYDDPLASKCGDCDGHGKLKPASEDDRSFWWITARRPCPTCEGSGRSTQVRVLEENL